MTVLEREALSVALESVELEMESYVKNNRETERYGELEEARLVIREMLDTYAK